MDAPLLRHGQRLRALLMLAALAGALFGASAAARAQQAAGTQQTPVTGYEIVSVRHDPHGSISASVQAPTSSTGADRFSALVDGVRADVLDVVIPVEEAASLVIAIDTSGSMAGAPIAAAIDAAQRLVDSLDQNDSVAIVAFAGEPELISDFTTDRAATSAALADVTAAGDTALYDAVSLASGLLEARPDTGPDVLVLLSDGQNSGPAADESGRESSITEAADAGVIVHAFGLGAEADVDYLGALAGRTGGSYSAVASEQFLAELFGLLGEQLSTAWQVLIEVPPLARGDHNLELLISVDGVIVERDSAFTVDNAGLLVPTLLETADPEVLEIDLDAAIPVGQLRVDAHIGDTPLTFSAGRVYVDAWTTSPGNQSVEIDAYVGDDLAYSTVVDVAVPALEPQLTVRVEQTPAEEYVLFATGRAQGPQPFALRVLAGDEELANTTDRELRMDYPSGRDVTVEIVPVLEEGFGPAVTSQEVEAPSTGIAVPGGASNFTNYVAILVLAIVGAGVAYFVTKRRRARAQPNYQALRRFRAPRDLPSRPEQRSSLGTLIVFGPGGSEQRVNIGLRPVTIGSSSQCDVVLEGAEIQPLHARVSGRGNGEFQIHGLAEESSRPFSGPATSEWVVLRAGESIALGEYEISIGDPVDVQAESA